LVIAPASSAAAQDACVIRGNERALTEVDAEASLPRCPASRDARAANAALICAQRRCESRQKSDAFKEFEEPPIAGAS
jgi:hypothetical protein